MLLFILTHCSLVIVHCSQFFHLFLIFLCIFGLGFIVDGGINDFVFGWYMSSEAIVNPRYCYCSSLFHQGSALEIGIGRAIHVGIDIARSVLRAGRHCWGRDVRVPHRLGVYDALRENRLGGVVGPAGELLLGVKIRVDEGRVGWLWRWLLWLWLWL